jgi:hypothetical protein
MIMTEYVIADTHPFPYMRDALQSWDRTSEETKAILIPLFGGDKFLKVIEESRAFLKMVESVQLN